MPPWLLTDVSPIETWRPHLGAGTLWVADVEGEPIGFLAGRIEGPRLHIDEVDVLRAHQGKGVGRRLLETAAAYARANGLTALSLTTFRNVPWNAPFYASFGFREWDLQDVPAGLRRVLDDEAGKGLRERCAMVMDL